MAHGPAGKLRTVGRDQNMPIHGALPDPGFAPSWPFSPQIPSPSSMVRRVLGPGILVDVAAQLSIALHLRGCEQLRRHQMVFQVSLAKLGLGNPNGGRCRVETAWRHYP